MNMLRRWLTRRHFSWLELAGIAAAVGALESSGWGEWFAVILLTVALQLALED